jgi:hypothetical protein
MKAVFVFLVPIMLLIVAAQIGGCVECEKAGGTYVKTVYGTYTCIKSK